MRKFAVTAALLVLAAMPVRAQTTVWGIDPAHSNARFSVRHLGISNVQGEFAKVSGTIALDEKDISKTSVRAVIDVASVDTRNSSRDTDLKSPNFFDVEKYPTMTFESKKIVAGEMGKKQMTGDLTLHGVTKEVTFDVDGPSAAIKDPWGNMRRGASATAAISRKDFGMTYGSGGMASGDAMIGDSVTITIDVEMVVKK
jgi:polyisoprenoid-binding protein YceI